MDVCAAKSAMEGAAASHFQKWNLESIIARVNQSRASILSSAHVLEHSADYLLASEGKRIRPLLLLCFANLGESRFYPSDNCYSAAAAIELLHEASLVHDDILDNSLIRRGRDAVGQKFGVRTATHLGAWVTSMSIAVLADIDPEIEITLKQSLQALVRAQLMEELPKAASYEIHQRRCIDIMQGKTGALFEMAIRVGLHLSRSEHGRAIDQSAALRFCEHMSLAFQVRDDLADLNNDDVIRKPGGNDLMQGNPTWPFLIWAAQHGYDRAWGRLEAAKGDKDKAMSLQQEIIASGTADEVKCKVEAELESAHLCLQAMPEGPALDIIRMILGKIAP